VFRGTFKITQKIFFATIVLNQNIILFCLPFYCARVTKKFYSSTQKNLNSVYVQTCWIRFKLVDRIKLANDIMLYSSKQKIGFQYIIFMTIPVITITFATFRLVNMLILYTILN